MHLLLRKQTLDSKGRDSVIDIEIAADEIAIGSDPSAEIQVAGGDIEERHLVLRAAGKGTLNYQCTRGASVSVRDKQMSKGKLVVGDSLLLQGHRFVVIAAPSGFDAALIWTPASAAADNILQKQYRTRLDQTFLARRWPALALLAITLLLGVVLPLASHFTREASSDYMLNRSAAFDVLWSSGPLIPAHQTTIGDNCGACHANGFEMVRNEACTSCHKNLADHVDFAKIPMPQLQQTRCATCHREHNEPHSLVVMADALCTDCHDQPASHTSAKINVDPVTRLKQGSHPEFDWHLLQPQRSAAGTGEKVDWKWRRLARSDNTPEQSNLKFPHDVHLDGSEVQSQATGAALACESCHVLSADREHFAPITMETSCRSCHDLRFDRRDPQKQLPHGSPSRVIEAMQEHYLHANLEPRGTSGPERRRLPDRDDDEEQCNDGALTCAKAQTAKEAERQFTQSGCVTCHEVVDTGIGDLYNRFQVLPVRLNSDWYPKARFDHVAHLTQAQTVGNARCTSCHVADMSSQSSDKLIPGLDNCTQCHDSVHSRDTIPLNCIDCHEFHMHADGFAESRQPHKEMP
jgi:predicted CXXCH cytochrome family protein